MAAGRSQRGRSSAASSARALPNASSGARVSIRCSRAGSRSIEAPEIGRAREDAAEEHRRTRPARAASAAAPARVRRRRPASRGWRALESPALVGERQPALRSMRGRERDPVDRMPQSAMRLRRQPPAGARSARASHRHLPDSSSTTRRPGRLSSSRTAPPCSRATAATRLKPRPVPGSVRLFFQTHEALQHPLAIAWAMPGP